ncbi:MAG: peptide chain release factor N(5)-glutamine methyltransferase [Planctomycetota bacterium]|nr:peptide chain release factor N(5)-glutamine methyltransferase [Planctomycetota bacterium]
MQVDMDHPLCRELLVRLERELEVLPDKPDETPLNTLNCLCALVAGRPLALSQAGAAELVELDQAGQQRLRQLVERRLANVPLAHLTGRQDFMGLVLLASEAALVPRRETELLGWAALGKIDSASAEEPLVVDLCTGSGNLALAMAVHAPQAKVWGSDLSPQAVELARQNARFVGRPDVTFVAGDLAEPFDHPDFLGRVDVLICNPPYISSAKVDNMHAEISEHEPRLAFDGGPFGVKVLLRLLKDAPRLLKAGGWLLFEVGLGQGGPMHKRLAGLPAFAEVESVQDANGDIRALAARRSAIVAAAGRV